MRHLLIVCLLCAAMVLPRSVFGSEPEGPTNLAAKSDLPSGNGLAAQFPGDAGLKKHLDVIFADDFETGALGAGWDETRNQDGKVLQFVAPGDAAGLGRRCLRVEAHLGKDTGGGLTKWFEPADPVFIRFYTRFDPGCDYVHHFVTLRANKGLHGGDKWSGFGGAGLKPDGTERFSTAIEPWGDWGRWPAPGRWNFYSYWHDDGGLEGREILGQFLRRAHRSGHPARTLDLRRVHAQAQHPGPARRRAGVLD